jgi:chlorobactene glucosyltransferase
MASPLLLLFLSTLALLVGLAITWWLHSQSYLDFVVTPTPLPPGAPAPLLSVIVPARNEARNIRRCVEALLAQAYPDLEVIVVDDRSSDETPHILAEILADHSSEPASDPATQENTPSPGKPHLHVIQGEELPAGWAGKPHALVQGVAASHGEWLCFVDADTFAGSHLLSSAWAKAEELRADLLTLLTDQELGSFWEKVVLPVVFMALSVGFPAQHVNDPRKPDAIANGQFILIRRAVYQAIGGHGAVKDRIDEDKGLAEAVKGAGYRLIFADGRRVVRTRMYTSLPEMWEGWTKNIFVGMRDRLGLLLVGALLGLIGALLLPVWLVGSILWYIVDGGWIPAGMTVEAVVLWHFLIWSRLQAARAFRISSAYAFTLPLAALVFTAMMFASAIKVLSGRGVSWRGRIYKPL